MLAVVGDEEEVVLNVHFGGNDDAPCHVDETCHVAEITGWAGPLRRSQTSESTRTLLTLHPFGY